MGGAGSGHWCRIDKKATVEDCWGLDINLLARGGRLQPFGAGTVTWTNTRTGDCASVGFVVTTRSDGRLLLTLKYRPNTGDEVTLPIRLQTTRPNYGGCRWWFTCPLFVRGVACQRRVGKLYLRGRYFGCRHCHDLTYESCQEAVSNGKPSEWA